MHRSRWFSRLFVLFYLFVALWSPFHRHEGAARTGSPLAKVLSVDADSGKVCFHTAPELSPSGNGCLACDFLANLVSPATQPEICLEPLAVSEIPAPALRSQPFQSYRFADRSSSRAPPIA